MLDAIAALVREQVARGGAVADTITARIADRGTPGLIEIGCGDGAALPPGAEAAMIGHALAALPPDVCARVRLVPRGSTPATAAARPT